MEREFLNALGLDPSAVDAVLAENDKDLFSSRQLCEAAQAELAQLHFDLAVQNAVRNVRFSSHAAERDFIAQLKNLNLEVVDGSLVGFDAFLLERKNAEPEMFAPDRPVPKFVAPVGSGGGSLNAAPLNVRQARELGAQRAAAMRSSGEVLKNFL